MRKEMIFLLIFLTFLIVFASAVKITEKSNDFKITLESLQDIKKEKIKIIAEYPSNDKNKANLILSNTKKELSNKVKHNFNSFNGFSAYLTKKEVKNLIQEGYEVYEDIEVYAFLDDSTQLINATNTWQIIENDLNLTGFGQTVCVIDTGVDYTHPDLGGCNPQVLTLNGTNESYVLQSGAYNLNSDLNWTITKEGYSSIAVHFVNLSMEDSYDFVYLYDGNGNIVASYSGFLEDFWSPSVQGESIMIRLISDGSVNDLGFNIDQTINGTTNLTYNWSSCKKVLGGWNTDSSNPNPLDDHGHGTHVAGIIAANGTINGVAPESRIIAIKSLDYAGNGDLGNTAAGIEWCVNNSEKYNISVISMSLGTNASYPPSGFNSSNRNNNNINCNNYYPYFTNVINAATLKNISVVVATGNNYNYTHISFPSCITNVTRVTSSDKNDDFSGYANRNALVRIIAPGTNIESSWKEGGYAVASGTSMSTPHVAGSIALIKQYLYLSEQSKTPLEIENALNNTGKLINESLSNRSYSRIDVLSAILSLDVDSPQVDLISPIDESFFGYGNVTFNCLGSDLYLSNISFYLWNSSNNIINYTSKNISSQNYNYQINITNLSRGSYSWNCEFFDQNENSAFSQYNYSFVIGNITTSLISPDDNNYTNISNTEFNCSAETVSSTILRNITRYLWNSSGYLINTNISNISGIENISISNYNFSNEGEYFWNCLAYNNLSESAFALINNSLIYDVTPPLIEISAASTSQSYIILNNPGTDSISGLNYCNISSSSATVSNLTISGLSCGQTYNINASCYDNAGNYNFSSSSLSTSSCESNNNGGGGGGSSGGNTNIINTIKEEELEIGYNKKVKTGDKFKFNISGQEHNLIVKKVNNNSIDLTLRSNETNFSLNIGTTKKFSLFSKEIYDISFTLNSIDKNLANITINKIFEKIPSKEEYPPLVTTENNETKKELPKYDEFIQPFVKKSKFIFYLLLIAIILIISISLIKYINKNKYDHKVHIIKYNLKQNGI